MTFLCLDELFHLFPLGIYITEDGNHLFVFVEGNVVLASSQQHRKEVKTHIKDTTYSQLKPQWTMGKGYYISKNLATAAMVLAAIALVTIIALSAVYNREKSKNAAKFTNTTTSPVPPTPKTSNEPWDKYRLPDTLSPEYYNVTLWPRLVRNANGMYIFTGSLEWCLLVWRDRPDINSLQRAELDSV